MSVCRALRSDSFLESLELPLLRVAKRQKAGRRAKSAVCTDYLFDLKQIGIFHNVFSIIDKVQTPAGTIPSRRGEGGALGENDKVINYRTTDDGAGGQPGHSDLHEPATWTASDLDALL